MFFGTAYENISRPSAFKNYSKPGAFKKITMKIPLKASANENI